jgi:uncharacterized SAM-binding protein YcdF (DUF218 family)
LPLKLVAVFSLMALALLLWAALARRFAPTSNTALTQFDAIIVLGYPADSDGNPSPRELASVTEAVREYERGVAPRLIFTGSDVANRYFEARVMSRAAEAQGIPASAVLLDTEARNTIQNACYAERIMKAHGWLSAEVIATPIHLRRAGIIFSHMPLAYRMHAAPPLEPPSAVYDDYFRAWEILKTARYLVWAREMDPCQP